MSQWTEPMTCRILALLVTSVALHAQVGEALGAGQRVPEFSLRDQSDRARSFADIRGRNGAMLVFYRSADW